MGSGSKIKKQGKESLEEDNKRKERCSKRKRAFYIINLS
jgi:hypothetical protein